MAPKTLLFAALAASASASVHRAMKRDLAGLLPRQTATATDDFSGGCLTAALSFYAELPTPPPEIVDWEASYLATATAADLCSVSLPASLSSAALSYDSELVDFITDHPDDISSLIAECPQLTSYTSELTAGDAALCTPTDAAGGSVTAVTATATDTDTAATTAATATGGGSAAPETTASGASQASATGSGSSSATGSSSSASASSSDAATAGAGLAREVGIAGAVFAGLLGVVAAL